MQIQVLNLNYMLSHLRGILSCKNTGCTIISKRVILQMKTSCQLSSFNLRYMFIYRISLVIFFIFPAINKSHERHLNQQQTDLTNKYYVEPKPDRLPESFITMNLGILVLFVDLIYTGSLPYIPTSRTYTWLK